MAPLFNRLHKWFVKVSAKVTAVVRNTVKAARPVKKVAPPDKRIILRLIDGHNRTVVPDGVGVTIDDDGFISVSWEGQSSPRGRTRIMLIIEV